MIINDVETISTISSFESVFLQFKTIARQLTRGFRNETINEFALDAELRLVRLLWEHDEWQDPMLRISLAESLDAIWENKDYDWRTKHDDRRCVCTLGKTRHFAWDHWTTVPKQYARNLNSINGWIWLIDLSAIDDDLAKKFYWLRADGILLNCVKSISGEVAKGLTFLILEQKYREQKSVIPDFPQINVNRADAVTTSVRPLDFQLHGQQNN